MADVDDQWHKLVDGKKVRTDKYGRGKRWRARWRDETGAQRQTSFDTKTEAQSVQSYLSCRLTRFLILLHKPSQDTTRRVYTFVPTQEWNTQWTDKDLYAKYSLSMSEIAFIEKIVRPMDLTNVAPDEAVSDDDE